MGKYILLSDCIFATNLGSISAAAIALTGISIANKTSVGTLAIGGTFTFTTAFTPTNATNKGYTYSSSNTSVATITSAGVMTILAYGTTTITVTSSYSNTIVDTVSVTISEIAVTAVLITNKATYASTQKTVGSTFNLTSSVTPSNAGNKNVSWSSSNTAIATVSSAGLVTVVGEGSVTITLTSSYSSAITDSVAFTGIAATSVIAPTAIDITNTPASSYNVGDTVQLAVSITPSNATDSTVSWLSSNTAIATVSNTGLVTIVGAGNATITATANGNTSLTDTFSVVAVTPVVATSSVEITTTIAASYNAGGTLQLATTVLPSNATDKSVLWSTSNSAIATVSSSGLVTFIAAGSVTITATSNANSALTDTADMTCVAASSGWKMLLQASYDNNATQKVASPTNGDYVNLNFEFDLTRSLVDTTNTARATSMSRAALATALGATPVSPTKQYNSDNKSTLATAIIANIPYAYWTAVSTQTSLGMVCYGNTNASSPYMAAGGMTGLPNGNYKIRFFLNRYSGGNNMTTGTIYVNGVAYPLTFQDGQTQDTSTKFCADLAVTITDGTLTVRCQGNTTGALYVGYNMCELEFVG